MTVDVKLVIFKSDGRTKEIPIKPGRYLVGRREGASLRIPLPSVSREHCEIVHENGRLHVRDLGSSNGTFRNSERVTEADLAAGDTLAVGQVQMTVCIDGKPAHPAPGTKASSADSSMMETPPAGLKSQPAKPAAPAPPAPAPAKAPARDPDQTTPKSDSSSIAEAPGGGHDESSIFEFDFDFEDDDRPRL